MPGSNQRPPGCKPGALPTELTALFEGYSPAETASLPAGASRPRSRSAASPRRLRAGGGRRALEPGHRCARRGSDLLEEAPAPRAATAPAQDEHRQGRDHLDVRPPDAGRPLRHRRPVRRRRRHGHRDQPRAGKRPERLGQERASGGRRDRVRQPDGGEPLRGRPQREASGQPGSRRFARLVHQPRPRRARSGGGSSTGRAAARCARSRSSPACAARSRRTPSGPPTRAEGPSTSRAI